VPRLINDDDEGDCLFEAFGADKVFDDRDLDPIDYDPPRCRERCRGIKSGEGLLTACKSSKGGCSRVTIAGHGVTGCGVCSRRDDEDAGQLIFGCVRGTGESYHLNEIGACLRTKLNNGGYVRICSCNLPTHLGMRADCLQYLATQLKVRVCMCIGTAGPTPRSYCECNGYWICRDPLAE